MRHFPALLRHELRSLMHAPSTYVASVLFLLLMAAIYYLLLSQYAAEQFSVPPTEMFFQAFWLPVLFMVPLLTMRSLAEERRLHTLETLLSAPVSTAEVILSKFAASWIFYCVLWLGTMLFPAITIYGTSGVDQRLLLDLPVLLGGFSFVCLSGLLFIAVGILSSTLTRSQLVAGMLCFCILFILLLGPKLIGSQELGLWSDWLREPLQYFDTARHRESFIRGVFDTRPLFYYITNSSLVLAIAALIVESKS
ncbi:MAG: ABC transporter permease subunit [Opitutales bacterium]|nr:ABC transporter permease subunit [Opitutales bacterium]